MPSRAGGAFSGAAAGALAGSSFGPIGAGIGGVLGLVSGYFGAGDKDKFVSTLNPQQQQQLSSVLGQLQQQQGQGGNYNQSQNYLSSILNGSPEAYEQFAAPYRTEFNERTLPGIAERFAGIGGGLGGGALGSSGFGQALGGAATQFNSNIAGLFANIRQQAAGQAMSNYGNLLNTGLGNYQAYQQGSPGFGGQALAGISHGVGQGIGQWGAYNMQNRFQNAWGNGNQGQGQQGGIYDTYGPNAGNGYYNAYTGYQG